MRMLWIGHCFINHHPRDGLSVFLLLRRVHPMGFEIDGERVHRVLHPEVLEFAIVVPVILVENSDGPAITRDINAAQTWIKFDDIRPAGHFEKRDWHVLVQVKTVINSFPSQERNARWCSGSSAIP